VSGHEAMDVRRLSCALFVVAACVASGCESESTDPAPTPVCIRVDGVWDVSFVGEDGTGITCLDRSLVWTIHQYGCDVTIESAPWDTANGATGGVTDNRLYVEWVRFENCYRYQESIDVTINGDMVTGAYYLARTQAVYPAYCPGLGLCRATVTGVRRNATSSAAPPPPRLAQPRPLAVRLWPRARRP
jgi:hypothetical protein